MNAISFRIESNTVIYSFCIYCVDKYVFTIPIIRSSTSIKAELRIACRWICRMLSNIFYMVWLWNKGKFVRFFFVSIFYIRNLFLFFTLEFFSIFLFSIFFIINFEVGTYLQFVSKNIWFNVTIFPLTNTIR